jgi:hypothetical protein
LALLRLNDASVAEAFVFIVIGIFFVPPWYLYYSVLAVDFAGILLGPAPKSIRVKKVYLRLDKKRGGGSSLFPEKVIWFA